MLRNILRVIIVPGVILAIGVAGFSFMAQSKPEVEKEAVIPPPPMVRVITAQLADYQLAVSSQGTVEPRTRTMIVAQVAGVVKSISPNLADGAFFKKGEVLARIDPRDYELAATQAKAAISQAQTRIEQETIQSKLALAEWKNLGEGEPSSLLARVPQLAEANAQLDSAKASLQGAKLQLSRTTLAAPYTGRVARKLVDMGQYVGPGTPIAEVYAVDVAEVRLPVSTDDLAFVDLQSLTGDAASGPAVTLTATLGGQKHTWRGQIVRTSGEIDPQSRMLTAIARIADPFALDEQAVGDPLPMGLFVQANILGRSVPGVVELPRLALRGGNQVIVISPGKRVELRDVQILRMERESIILKSGVAAGELVCVSPMDVVVDDMPVRIAGESQS